MKKLIFTFLICAYGISKAQTTYVDIMTAPAMLVYAGNLKSSQEKTIDEMSAIKQKQAWLTSQMVLVNDVQNKVYKGLSQVNSVVSNGLQLKRIYDELSKMPGNLQGVYQEVSSQPEYSVFGVKAGQLVYNKSIEYYAEVSELLSSGEFNLMTSGDRMLLLESLEQKTRMLNFYLINIKYSIMRAKAKGWWRAINPFQDYMDTDKAIFDQIINQAAIY